MSAARLPYYQQLPEDEQRRRSTSRGRSGAGQRTNGAYHERNSTRRNYSRSRSRSRSVERRRYSRSRSRSTERQRRRNSRHQQQHRRHKDSSDARSWDADRRERDREYSRRHQRDSRSRSATPPPSSSGSRRQQQQQQQPHGGKQGRIGGSVEDNVDDMRIPLPTNATSKDKAMSAVGAYYNLDTDEPFDKERIHREIEEKLRQTLAREGKIYPPPKPEASHPVFANDGSFMELFKKMQEEQQRPPQLMMMEQHPHPDAALIAATAAAAAATAALRDQQQQHLDNTATVSGFGALPAIAAGAASSPAAPYIAAAAAGKSAPPPPMVGRRRGGKILKTGVVAKLKAPNERDVDPKDFWSLYLAEVNKYKSNACDTDNGKRPLVK